MKSFIEKHSKYFKTLLSIVGGFAFSLGYPNTYNIDPSFYLSIVGWFTLSFLFRISSSKEIVFINFIFCLTFYFGVFSWIHVGLRNFNIFHPQLNFLFDGLLFIYQTFHLLLIPLAIILLSRIKSKALQQIVIPVILAGSELIFTQLFPTNIGGVFIDVPWLLGAVEYGGIYFYSFILYYFFILVVTKENMKTILCAFSVLIISLFVLKTVEPSKSNKSFKPLKIRMSQTGVINYFPHGDDNEKNWIFKNQTYSEIVDSFSSGLENIDFHILGETFYPYDDFSLLGKEINYPEKLKSFFKKPQETIVGSLLREDIEGRSYRSGVAHIINARETSSNSTYKKLLVPLAEDFPSFRVLDLLNEGQPSHKRFLTGRVEESKNHFKTISGYSYGLFICWEILFPHFMQSSSMKENKIDFIVNIANESFFQSTSELALHLYLARFRSLEFGVPVLKVSRTGITAYIEEGKIIKKINQGEVDHLDISINKKREDRTVFHRYGLLGSFALGLIYLFFVNGSLIGWKFLIRKKHA